MPNIPRFRRVMPGELSESAAAEINRALETLHRLARLEEYDQASSIEPAYQPDEHRGFWAKITGPPEPDGRYPWQEVAPVFTEQGGVYEHLWEESVRSSTAADLPAYEVNGAEVLVDTRVFLYYGPDRRHLLFERPDPAAISPELITLPPGGELTTGGDPLNPSLVNFGSGSLLSLIGPDSSLTTQPGTTTTINGNLRLGHHMCLDAWDFTMVDEQTDDFPGDPKAWWRLANEIVLGGGGDIDEHRLSGVVAPEPTGGCEHWITNRGPNPLILLHQSPDSLEANRLYSPTGWDWYIEPDASVLIRYRDDLQRWTILRLETEMRGATSLAPGRSGLVPAPEVADLNKLLGGDGTWKTVSGVSVMTGATLLTDGEEGLVPQPLAGDHGKFLRGDATWQIVSTGGGPGSDGLNVNLARTLLGTYTAKPLVGTAANMGLSFDVEVGDCIMLVFAFATGPLISSITLQPSGAVLNAVGAISSAPAGGAHVFGVVRHWGLGNQDGRLTGQDIRVQFSASVDQLAMIAVKWRGHIQMNQITGGTSGSQSGTGTTGTKLHNNQGVPTRIGIAILGTLGPVEDDPPTWANDYINGERVGTTGGGGDVTATYAWKLATTTRPMTTTFSGITSVSWAMNSAVSQ